MPQTRMKNLGSQTGKARLLLDDVEIAQGRYHFDLVQPIHNTPSLAGPGTTPGLPILQARLDAVKGQPLEPGQEYTLLLEDGRSGVCWFQHLSETSTGVYQLKFSALGTLLAPEYWPHK